MKKRKRQKKRSDRGKDRTEWWFVFLVFLWVLDSPPLRSAPGVRVRGGKGRLAPPSWGK